MVCPTCKTHLIVDKKKIHCKKCNTSYDVRYGIPVLIDKRNLSAHNLSQIKYFNQEKESSAEAYVLEEWQKNYIDRFLENFPNIKNKKVIDCGTGSGYMSVELAKKGAYVVSCDLTFNSLKRLKKIVLKKDLDKRTNIVCCSAEELPFESGYFDYYISNAVLEHLPNEYQAIKEAKRVTKKDAGIMISVPIAYKYVFPLLVPVNYIHDKRIGHLRRYTQKIIETKFAGWKNVGTYYTGHVSKVIKTIVNMYVDIFDKRIIEKQDKMHERTPVFSSNIICFLKRQKVI